METNGQAPIEERSAKWRHTMAIADLANFDYHFSITNKYGGTFTIFQMEIIEARLRKLKAIEEGPREATA